MDVNTTLNLAYSILYFVDENGIAMPIITGYYLMIINVKTMKKKHSSCYVNIIY